MKTGTSLPASYYIERYSTSCTPGSGPKMYYLTPASYWLGRTVPPLILPDVYLCPLPSYPLTSDSISEPQYPTHYTPQGNGNVIGIKVHRSVLLSDVTVSDVLDSDHILIFFHILNHVSARDISTLLKPTQNGSGFEA